jgi:hypothetical protein
MMNVLFCESVLDPNKVDEMFVDEYDNAKKNGFNTLLYNYEELSTKKIKPRDKLEKIIYRGWMITPNQYEKLYNELLSKNYELINNPKKYKNCHYLPDSLEFIKEYTPKTIFQKLEDENSLDILFEKVKIFENRPIIIKDYVKSEKHYWNTAFFVENASNIDKLKQSINNFIEIRGDSLNEGIVIREYIELNNLSVHPKSGMPLSEEYRLFFYNKSLINIYDYWDEVNYDTDKPNIDRFKKIAQNIDSNFFTMDIGREKNGNYTIIELGDGQVSGIPDNADKNNFYNILKNCINKN